MIMLSAVRQSRLHVSTFAHALPSSEMATNLDGRNFRDITGFKLIHSRVESKCLEAIVTKFQEEGIW